MDECSNADNHTAKLQQQTLEQLAAGRAAMLQLEYLVALDQLPEEQQKEAALRLHRLQLCYLRLRQAQLTEIREELEAHRGQLTRAIGALRERLEDIRNVQLLAGAAAELTEIIGRIIGIRFN